MAFTLYRNVLRLRGRGRLLTLLETPVVVKRLDITADGRFTPEIEERASVSPAVDGAKLRAWSGLDVRPEEELSPPLDESEPEIWEWLWFSGRDPFVAPHRPCVICPARALAGELRNSH